jgi:anti-sigma factor RsiW
MADCMHRKQLMAYHDGELPPKRRREVERHVEGCPACAAELAQLRALSGLLQDAEAPVMPEDVLGRLHGALPTGRERSILRLCRAVAVAAAVLLVISGGSLWYETARPGGASAAPAAWEVAAVTPERDATRNAPGEAFALWAVNDLSRENGR